MLSNCCLTVTTARPTRSFTLLVKSHWYHLKSIDYHCLGNLIKIAGWNTNSCLRFPSNTTRVGITGTSPGCTAHRGPRMRPPTTRTVAVTSPGLGGTRPPCQPARLLQGRFLKVCISRWGLLSKYSHYYNIVLEMVAGKLNKVTHHPCSEVISVDTHKLAILYSISKYL